MARTTIRVALDWTPNTYDPCLCITIENPCSPHSRSIHSGLYLAIEKNLYAEQNLDVQLLPPDEDYTKTPARRLADGEVDLAICPSESCIAYNESGRMKLQAIYAILQRDASAIASTRVTEIKALGEGTYGSYNAKYEDAIVRAMVKAAGGNGKDMRIKNSTGKLSLFQEVRKGEIDATWIFLPWEGVEADLDGENVHAFRPEEYGVPYGYSPVIARNADSSLADDALRKFVKATAKGYEYSKRESREAVAVLGPFCRPPRTERFLEASQGSINGYYSDGSDRLGYMRPDKWEAWIKWLREQGLLEKDIDIGSLYTNEFFG